MEALQELVRGFAGLGPALRPPRHRRDRVIPRAALAGARPRCRIYRKQMYMACHKRQRPHPEMPSSTAQIEDSMGVRMIRPDSDPEISRNYGLSSTDNISDYHSFRPPQSGRRHRVVLATCLA